MAVGRPKTELVLSAEEHAQVSALAASRSLPHAIVARAKLVLWAAQGESNPGLSRWKATILSVYLCNLLRQNRASSGYF